MLTGEKFQTTMPSAYDHSQIEQKVYEVWERSGIFTPKIDWSRKPFTIVIPPPNVTGELHNGHSFQVAFEDLMIRWRRMQGIPALWLPGTDHAGIATQNVVERELAKQGKTRSDLGREAFEQMVWDWREKYGGIILQQLRRLGASCDWSRERFTMDSMLSRAVREAFVRLYNKGLIYQGNYIVNWCPRCSSAISDLEVDHEETEGKLYYVRYRLADEAGRHSDQFVTVATTRPETILGDTGVAVHPDDERYKALVGRRAILPAIRRLIPIIADPAVDPKFGTGAVKVTPAHDPNDFDIGQRAGLPIVVAMDEAARMNQEAGPYAGLDRYECRRRLVADLERDGLLVKIEPHTHAVGHCQRCNTVIEPLLSKQWFVKIKPLAEPASEAVRNGSIHFVPERFTKIYFNWMENIRDWCISRQLWWGHRIPVWYCDDCGEMTVAIADPTNCSHCGSANIQQDPDVLDTWFSSGLWPFSTLGWPDDSEDLRYFYPTSVMETGYDIIFFWVARMIMLGIEFTGQPPFRVVYLHGLLRDAKGEKMSKSKGNVVNPLDLIAKYGADALRFTIVTGGSPGQDQKMSDSRLEGSRNFANKLWNAARFVLMTVGDDRPAAVDPADLGVTERWILSRANRTVEDVTRLMEDYQFGEAGRIIYDFAWGEFCDWYLELAKIRLQDGSDRTRQAVHHTLLSVLETILRLLHPFMPFVTEAIWGHLPNRNGLLVVANWPVAGPTDSPAEEEIGQVVEVVRAIRNVRAEFRVPAGSAVAAIVVAGDRAPRLESNRPAIERLARTSPLTIVGGLAQRPTEAFHLLAGVAEVYLPFTGMIDLAKERERTAVEIEQTRQKIARVEERLSSDGFVNKAPAEVVERERGRLAELNEQVAKLIARAEALG